MCWNSSLTLHVSLLAHLLFVLHMRNRPASNKLSLE